MIYLPLSALFPILTPTELVPLTCTSIFPGHEPEERNNAQQSSYAYENIKRSHEPEVHSSGCLGLAIVEPGLAVPVAVSNWLALAK